MLTHGLDKQSSEDQKHKKQKQGNKTKTGITGDFGDKTDWCHELCTERPDEACPPIGEEKTLLTRLFPLGIHHVPLQRVYTTFADEVQGFNS